MIRKVKTGAVILSFALAFSGMCGCGGNATAPVEETVQEDAPEDGKGDLITDEDQFAGTDEEPAVDEITEADTEPADEDDVETAEETGDSDNAYGALYLDKVNELKSEGLADQFALAEIDEDDIPELIASDSEGSFEHENAFIFTIVNDEVVELASVIAGVDGGNLDYAQGANLIHISGSAAGMRDVFSQIKDGRLEEVFTAEASSMDENAKYSVNGSNVKEDEYYGMIDEFVKDYNPMTRIAYDGLYEVNYKYDGGYGGFEQGGSQKYSPVEEITMELK